MNTTEENNEIKWWSIGCTSAQKELKVRDDARKAGLEAFVPLKYSIKSRKKRKVRALVPVLSGMIFIKGTEDEVKDYIMNKAHFTVFIRKSTFSNKEDYLTVSVKAMDNFIAVIENHEAHITYFKPEEIKLQVGDQIRVKGGIYDGKEGIIMRIKGKRNKHLVVQIPGILVAAIEMAPDLVEVRSKKSEVRSKKIEIKEKPSDDIEEDKKLLYENAYRVLFDFADKYKDDSEYYLLLSEVKRAKARLETFKGFTPATEAELALPMFMAAVAIDEDIEPSKERLIKAIDRLKSTSKLKAKCQEMLGKLTIDN